MSHLRECVVKDCERKETFWNERFAEMFGGPPLVPVCHRHQEKGVVYELKPGVILFDGSTTLRWDTTEEINAQGT